MDLNEYQGKQLFKRFGIPVSEGRLATTPEEARAAAEELGGPVVVKAQVLTGGRGKAGGVKLAEDPADAEQKARDIIGLDIRGHVVEKVWIEQASDIAKEYYLSITFDRGAKKPLFMFTTQGGVEIEEVAENDPDALVRLHVDALEGFQPWIARRLVYGAGVDRPVRAEADRRDHREALSLLRRVGRDAHRDQPADRDAGRRGEGARLEVHGRRQRALPPSRHRGVPRHGRSRPARGVRAREGRHLRQARRLGRHPRQRRRALDVDRRRRRRRRRQARELLRPRRRRQRGGRRRRARGDHAATRRSSRSSSTSSAGSRAATRSRAASSRRSSACRSRRPIVVRLDGTNAEEGRQILADAAPPNLHVEPTMLEAAKKAVELAA